MMGTEKLTGQAQINPIVGGAVSRKKGAAIIGVGQGLGGRNWGGGVMANQATHKAVTSVVAPKTFLPGVEAVSFSMKLIKQQPT